MIDGGDKFLERVTLIKGAGIQKSHRCAMQVVSILSGESTNIVGVGRVKYRPECTSPSVTSFIINMNDKFPDYIRQRMKPYLPYLIGCDKVIDSSQRIQKCTRRRFFGFLVFNRNFEGMWKVFERELQEILDLSQPISETPNIDNDPEMKSFIRDVECGIEYGAKALTPEEAKAFAMAAYIS